MRTGLSGIVVVGRRGGLPPSSLLPPGRGEAGWGVDPGSADRAGESPDRPRTPAAPPSLLPPGRGAGGDDPPPPTRAGAGPPSRPPPFQGGGEKAAAVRLPVRRRGRSRVLPPSLLPPGRGEAGWGVDPGSADRAGESPDRPRTPAAPPSLLPPGRGAGGDDPPPPTRAPARDPPPDLPPEGGRREEKGGGEKAAAVRLPVRRRGRSRVLPLSLLPPGRGEGRRQCGQDSPASSSLDEEADRRHLALLPQGNRIQESANGRPYLPGAPGERSFLERTPRRRPRRSSAPDHYGLSRTIPDYPGLSRTIPDYPGQERAENTPKIPPRPAAGRRKSLKTRGLPKPLRIRTHRSDGPRAAIARPCRTPCLRLRQRCGPARGA